MCGKVYRVVILWNIEYSNFLLISQIIQSIGIWSNCVITIVWIMIYTRKLFHLKEIEGNNNKMKTKKVYTTKVIVVVKNCDKNHRKNCKKTNIWSTFHSDLGIIKNVISSHAIVYCIIWFRWYKRWCFHYYHQSLGYLHTTKAREISHKVKGKFCVSNWFTWVW